ncbi:MAG TPA: HD domain-containing protein, partial [Geobacteraceae bacterium]
SHDLLEHCLRAVEHAERLAARPTGLPGGERLAAHLASRHEAGVTRHALLKWAAFFHDVAKPATKSEEPSGRVRFIGHDTAGGVRARRMLAALRVGKKTARAAERLVAGHMRLFGLAHQERPTARARLRYLKNFGDETPEALLLSLADEKATGPRPPSLRRLRAVAAELLALYWASLDGPPAEPLLRGRDLREELGLAEGKKIGEILRAVGEAESAGEISTREEAMTLARKLAQE